MTAANSDKVKTMQFTARTLAVLLALAATACESSVYSVTQERLYSPARAHYAAGAKSLNTIIRGNPFEASQDVVNGLVIDEMHRGMSRVDTALRRRPMFAIDGADEVAGETRADYFVALALNPAAGTDAATLCADPEGVAVTPAATPAGRIVARMVFCFDGRVLSTAHGVVDGAIDPTDPQFRRLIVTMTRALFPFRKFRDGFNERLI